MRSRLCAASAIASAKTNVRVLSYGRDRAGLRKNHARMRLVRLNCLKQPDLHIP
jgi:hypothetical protein